MPTRVWLGLLILVGGFCVALVRSRSYVILLALLLAPGCAHAVPATVIPPPAVRATPPVDQLARILEIKATDGAMCHATPVGIVQLLTAAHCVGSGVIRFRGQHGIEGDARLLWRDDKADLAMFLAVGVPGWDVVPISRAVPLPMTDLFWRAYIPELRSVSIRGEFIGMDGDNDMTLSGFVTPGASGSGVLNAAGELVGVVHAAYNTLTLGTGLRVRDWPGDTGSLIQMLADAVKFSPAGVASPVNDWPKGPR